MDNKKTLLIVEDDTALIKVLTQKFTVEGLNVFQAKDGQEGLEMSLQHHPDLILLDIIMPKMDGLTMLKKLREDAWGKNAQVLVLTNLSSVEKENEALQQNVYNYLVKTNWTLEDLVQKVKQNLNP